MGVCNLLWLFFVVVVYLKCVLNKKIFVLFLLRSFFVVLSLLLFSGVVCSLCLLCVVVFVHVLSVVYIVFVFCVFLVMVCC